MAVRAGLSGRGVAPPLDLTRQRAIGEHVRSAPLKTGEGELLRRCLVGQAPAQWDEHLDAAAVQHALDSHRITCTVHPVLSPLPGLPSELRQFIHERRVEMARRLLTMQADLSLVSTLLAAMGVPWLVIKGPITAQTLYGDLRSREWSDLDVVVGRRSYGDALTALEAAGAELLDRNWRMVSARMQAQLSLQLPHGTLLDLHWHLLNGRARRSAFPVDMDGLFADRVLVNVQGVTVPALAPVDQLVHLALHACLSGAHRLQWIKDLQLAADSTSDWSEVVERAREWQTQLPSALVLERTVTVLDARVPPQVLDALSTPRGWRAVGRFATRFSPPQDSHLDRLSGRAAFSSVRTGTASTALEVLRNLRKRPRRGAGLHAANPLHQPGGTAADRSAYLARVAGAGVP